jgi:hypothetical protein
VKALFTLLVLQIFHRLSKFRQRRFEWAKSFVNNFLYAGRDVLTDSGVYGVDNGSR